MVCVIVVISWGVHVFAMVCSCGVGGVGVGIFCWVRSALLSVVRMFLMRFVSSVWVRFSGWVRSVSCSFFCVNALIVFCDCGVMFCVVSWICLLVIMFSGVSARVVSSSVSASLMLPCACWAKGDRVFGFSRV